MVCRTVKIGDTYAIVCGPRPRRRACKCCGRPAAKLCDYPKGKGTCDAPLCDRCAVKAGPDVDHCPDHQPGLF